MLLKILSYYQINMPLIIVNGFNSFFSVTFNHCAGECLAFGKFIAFDEPFFSTWYDGSSFLMNLNH